MKRKSGDIDWSKSFMYGVHQMNFLVEKRLGERLAKIKALSFSQFLILLPLQRRGMTSQTEVAEFLYLTEATVSRHVTALANEGYLTRKEEPGNRRKHILTVTKKGEKEFTKAHTLIEHELREIFDVIPKKNRKEITKAFDRVLQKLLHS